MPLLPNTNSSDLIKSLQARTIYANYIVQQQKISQGCITVVSRANTQASDLYKIHEGGQFTTPTFQSTLLADPANSCPISVVSVAPVVLPILKLLVLGDSSAAAAASVISARLTALGYTGFTVDNVDIGTTYTGATLTTTNYNTALIWTNSSHTGATGLGAAIRSFVNAGGNVVSATFIWNLYASDMDFTTTPFQAHGQSNDSTAIMIVDVVHPITTGVTLSLNGGSTVLTNGTVVLQSGATKLAHFTATGDTLAAINTVGSARLVGLNLFISNLSSTPIRDLTVNACLWANRDI